MNQTDRDQTQTHTTVHSEGAPGTFGDLMSGVNIKPKDTNMTDDQQTQTDGTTITKAPPKKRAPKAHKADGAQAVETTTTGDTVTAAEPRAKKARKTDVQGELLEIVADHDLDGMCAAWATRYCRPGFNEVRVELVNSRSYDHTKDHKHAARVRGGSVAVDIVIPGLHSVKMASMQGVFSEVPKDLRSQRGSAFKAVMDMFASPGLKWALGPVIRLIEDYDAANNPLAQWGDAMMYLEPEQRSDLESVTIIGLYRNLLKGFWVAGDHNSRYRIFEIISRYLEGYIENRRANSEVRAMIQYAQGQGGTDRIRYSEDGLTVFLTEPGEITQSVAFDLGAHACVSRRKDRNGNWQVSVTRAKYVPGLEVNTPEILACFKPAGDRYVENWYVTSPKQGDKVDFGALCAKVAMHVTAVNNS